MTCLRIGFDVSSLKGFGGVSRYSREIIENLCEYHPEHELVLLSSLNRPRSRILGGLLRVPDSTVRRVLPNPLALGKSLRRLVSSARGSIMEFCSSEMDVLHLTRPFADRVPAGNLVLTVHDLFPLLLEEYRGEEAEREFRRNAPFMMRQAAAVIVPSEFISRQVGEIFPFARERTFVVPHAASAAFLPAEEDPNTPADLPREMEEYFLYVGSGYPRKNLRRVIGAYGSLPDRVREGFGLILVLTGVERHVSAAADDLSPLIERGEAVVLGGVPEDELARLYSSAASLVFPSICEGFGLPVLEAMQCGCPVITSNTTSLPEVAGDAALFVDPLSTDSIREAMLRMAEDPGLRSSLSSAGRERASRFSWSDTVRRNLEVYSSILT